MKAAYLIALLGAIGCLVLCDYRYHLAFFFDTKRTFKTLITCWVFFLLWDILGVGLGIFFPGSSRFVLGVEVLPNVPVEELFFLFLLTYITLLLWRGVERGTLPNS